MPSTSSPRRSTPSPLRVAGRVAAWAVVLSSLAALAVALVVPRLGGATPYAVLTGSMQPTLPPGTLVVVKPAAPEDIGVGTVITYQLESGEPTVVTHRVTAVVRSLGGEVRFRTRGDANSAPDRDLVRPVQVRGSLWYSVPYVGYFNRYVDGDRRDVATGVVAAGLLAYAALMVGTDLRARLRSRRSGSSAEVVA